MRKPALLLLLTALVACSSTSSDEEQSAEAIIAPVPVTHFQATWKPETVVLDDAQISASLLNRIAEDGVYRFKPASDLEAKLAVGKVVLMTGVNLVRVTAREADATAITIHTEPAALQDAAEDADLDWNIPNALPVFTPPAAPTGAESTGSLLRPLGVANITPDGKSASFQGQMGAFAVGLKYTRAPTALNAELTVSYDVADGKLKLVGSAAINAMNVGGKLGVKKGATSAFDVDIDNLDMTFELAAGMVQTGKGLEKLKVPVQVRIPFMVGALPMYVGVGIEVEIESLVGPQSSVFFNTKCRMRGKSGLTYDGKTLKPRGTLDGLECTSVAKEYLAATVNFGVGVRVDFPKITLGVGLVNTVGEIPIIKPLDSAIEGFVSVKHEAVGNVVVTREAAGPYPVIVGTCYSLDTNEGIFAGGAFRIAGLELKQEMQLIGRQGDHKELGAGKGCSKK